MRRGLLEGVLYRQASNHIRLGKGEFSGVSNAGLKDNGEPPRRVVRETYWDAITEPNPAARFWNAHFTGLPPAQPPQKLLATALSRFLRFTTFSSTKGLISGRRPGYSKEVPK